MPQTLADRAALASPLPLLTAHDARALGVRVPGPEYQRVRSGVYVDAAAWHALPSWQRYHVRVLAFHLRHPDAILCLESAAVILGLPLFGHPRDVHVYDPSRRASRRFGDVCVHTSGDPRAVVEAGGILVTGLLDTVVDLARVLPPAHGLAVADAAVSPAQGGPLDLAALREHSLGQRARRGASLLRALWPLVDVRIESPHESVSHAVMVWSGFERPTLQEEYHYEGYEDRVDFAFPSVRGIGEADGWGKYHLEDPAGAAAALTREKRREDRLRRNGHRFTRWDPADSFRVAPVQRALRAMGVPMPYAAQPALLTTVRRPSPRTVGAAPRR